MSTDPDEQLVERLRAIADTVRPRPSIVDEAARAALSTRRLDELAELLLDSEAGTPELARSLESGVRLLSFGTGSVSVELQVVAAPGGVALRGLVEGAVGEVTVEAPGSERRAALDENGWFSVEPVPAGLCRLRLSTSDGHGVTTAWVTL